jgi:tellurite resistance protein TerC
MITAAKKILIGLMGGTVLLIGIIMIVTPGPAVVVIPVGLAILATEFAWARHYKEKLEEKWAALRRRRQKRS